MALPPDIALCGALGLPAWPVAPAEGPQPEGEPQGLRDLWPFALADLVSAMLLASPVAAAGLVARALL